MDYTKIIHDFMDGTIDSTQEEQMFYQFSSNEELRAELKQQIAIREAIRSDSRAYTPAANSTVGVFAALGFNPPSTVSVANPSISGGEKGGFFTKYRQGLISSIVSVVGTAALFILLMNPFASSENINLSGSGKQSSFSNSQNIPENIPIVKSESNDVQKTQVKYITKIRYIDVPRYVVNEPVQSVQEETNTIATNEESDNNNLTSSDLGTTLTSGLVQNNKTNGFSDLDYSLSSDNFKNLLLSGEPIGLSAEIRGTQYWNFDKVFISPFKYAEFNNTSFALYYKLMDNFSVGGEWRRENFYQKFESVKGDTIFQQQPNFNTYGINLRYTAPIKLWGFEPILQGSIGLNNSGVTGRIMPGVTYSPYRDITIILGAEFSWLGYQHKNNIFYTGKFGFNYGIAYNF